MNFLDGWTEIATTLFAQALTGEPELVESFPKPLEAGSFAFAAVLDGDEKGRFSITLDAAVLDSPLLGEGVDQKAGWNELLREVCDAAAGEILAKTGKKIRVVKFEPAAAESQVSRAFQLRSADRAWTILVRDEVRSTAPAKKFAAEPAVTAGLGKDEAPVLSPLDSPVPPASPGVELLLDVELEATLRFGCREMPLGEILELGPGDVVQLDRHISDPVDLIVGDKIVARGEVVLINGNFGLRVTEVAAPRKRLESIRCLF
jgi:flagellar motor switch protein FliN/FliY